MNPGNMFFSQAELFFKWIKQYFRVKSLFGILESSVKTQIRIAVSVYAAVAIIKKHYRIEARLYTMLQMLHVTVLEKILLFQMFDQNDYKSTSSDTSKHFKLFN